MSAGIAPVRRRHDVKLVSNVSTREQFAVSSAGCTAIRSQREFFFAGTSFAKWSLQPSQSPVRNSGRLTLGRSTE